MPPAACVAIEDSHWGLQSARDAGMRTIAITHTYPRDTLEADRVIDSLDELTVDLVRGLPAAIAETTITTLGAKATKNTKATKYRIQRHFVIFVILVALVPERDPSQRRV